jgi:hypothetical protein
VGIFGARLLDERWNTLFFPYTNEISLGKNDPFAATLTNEPTQVCVEIAVIGVGTGPQAFSPFSSHGNSSRLNLTGALFTVNRGYPSVVLTLVVSRQLALARLRALNDFLRWLPRGTKKLEKNAPSSIIQRCL